MWMLPNLRAFGYGVGLRLSFGAKKFGKTPDPYEMDREMTGPVLIHISASAVLW
jgi:hypothetical protein